MVFTQKDSVCVSVCMCVCRQQNASNNQNSYNRTHATRFCCGSQTKQGLKWFPLKYKSDKLTQTPSDVSTPNEDTIER